MKKLVLFLTAVLLTAISANVFAQSTGTTPAPGATHAYSVDLTAGSSYAWIIYTTDGTNLTPVDDTDIGIDLISPNIAGDSLFITWASDIANIGNEYLISVTETATNTCSNTKALPIIITASTFDLIVAGTGDQNCYDNPVTISWSGGQIATDVTYTHGAATYAFTVEGAGVGLTETWTFSLGLLNTPADATTTNITVEDRSATPVTITPVGEIYTLTGPQTVDVTVVATNSTAYDNDSAADAQDFQAAITLGDISSGTGAIESDDTNNSGVENIARPNTSGISTN